MAERVPAWTATGIIEAPIQRVVDTLLVVREGPVGQGNARLLATIPGVGRFMARARLTGGPDLFALHYGSQAGGTVEVDRARRWFAMQGGFKFRAEYVFEPHERGTLLTYRVFNVAPPGHQPKPLVRFQFWATGKVEFGMRGLLRRINSILDCPTHLG